MTILTGRVVNGLIAERIGKFVSGRSNFQRCYVTQFFIVIETKTMLAKRIIPCLDVHAGRVVKGVNFVNLQDAGDPVEIARKYEQQGADELVFLDITASHEERDIILDVVARTSEVIFMPLTVGGGIRTVEDIRKLLSAGCDKVSINSAAVKTPEFISEAALRFGSQCIVVNLDPKRVQKDGREFWDVHINGGRLPTGLEVVEDRKSVV